MRPVGAERTIVPGSLMDSILLMFGVLSYTLSMSMHERGLDRQ